MRGRQSAIKKIFWLTQGQFFDIMEAQGEIIMIIEQTINKILEKHGKLQTNLASKNAREQIANEIIWQVCRWQNSKQGK